MTPIEIRQQISQDELENDILPAGRPVILRGLVADWPTVKLEANKLCQYLLEHDNGQPVDTIMLPPQEQGRVFYNQTMDGFNFLRRKQSLSSTLEQLLRYSHFDNPPVLAVQSAMIASCLPDFLATHRLPLNLPGEVKPRLWLGSQVVTPAHFDESHNIACVLAGKRRFILLPPEQVGNLYLGPLDFAPTPTPISLVNFRQPDLQNHPRFVHAMAHWQVAELQAGDALYIPPYWWHHVESLAYFNVLVNYWWQGNSLDSTSHNQLAESASPLSCLLHCMQHMRGLPPTAQRGWQAMFAHFLFPEAAQANQAQPDANAPAISNPTPPRP